MTPETLRSAVAAAVATDVSSRPQRRASTATAAKPEIETLTLNGFRIRPPDPPTAASSFEHHFRVTHFPDASEFVVTVAIDREAVERVSRLTRRRLEPGGAFWRLQAERRLAADLWSEGKAPDDRRLTVSDISREDLDVAAVWESD